MSKVLAGALWLVQYVKARLAERSTLMLIGSGIGTAAMLTWPWSAASLVVHTIAAFVPDNTPKGNTDDQLD